MILLRSVEDLADTLGVQAPEVMSPIPRKEREARAAACRATKDGRSKVAKEESSLSSELSNPLKAQISAWREDIKASLLSADYGPSDPGSDSEAEALEVDSDVKVWFRDEEGLGHQGDVMQCKPVEKHTQPAGQATTAAAGGSLMQDSDKVLSFEVSTESLGSCGSALKIASSASEIGSVDAGEDSFARPQQDPSGEPQQDNVVRAATLVDLSSTIMPESALGTPFEVRSGSTTKKNIGVEKSRETEEDEHKWKSQFQRYHESRRRLPVQTNTKTGVPVPLKSSHVGKLAKVYRPEGPAHSSESLLAPARQAAKASQMREVSLGNHELPFNTAVVPAWACRIGGGFKRRKGDRVTLARRAAANSFSMHDAIDFNHAFHEEASFEGVPEGLPARPSTSQGFTSGMPLETSHARTSRSAQGSRAKGKAGSRSLLVSVPSPMLGGWDRRTSPMRTPLRSNGFAVSNESSFDSPMNSASFGESTPLPEKSSKRW